MASEQRRRSAVDYLIASKRCEINTLRHLLETGQLVVAVSNLVHALQRERGASNMFIGAEGARYGAELGELVAESRQRQAALGRLLAELDTEAQCYQSGSRLFSRIAYVIQGLDELETVRGKIRGLDITPQVVIAGYSKLVRGLLNVVFEAADAAADPDISRALVALFNFMQGKELAGQERALGAATFAMGGFDARSRERLLQLIDSQERSFQSFAEFADPEPAALWRETQLSEHTAEVERLRRIACTVTGAGDAGLSDNWFDRTTRRIDLMKAVEDRLQAGLRALCECKLSHAEQDLATHEDQLAALAAPDDGETGFAVFFTDGAEPGAGGAFSAEGMGPQLARSIIELVQSQSQRLQSMHEELTAARAALHERKTIEKAKGLIMQHHAMSEEEAYRFLRQLAMRQGRKLAEVASATVAMAEVLQKRRGR